MNKAKVKAVSPHIRLGDVRYNKGLILSECSTASGEGYQYVVFPKDCLTGATLGDLASQTVVTDAVTQAKQEIAAFCGKMGITAVLESCTLPGLRCICAADPMLVGSTKAKIDEIVALSQQEHCTVVYANAGEGESGTDFVYSGACIVACEGELLSAPEPLPRCEEIFAIQTRALAARLSFARCRSAVIGVSGGLDSTLALLVCCRAADMLGWDRGQVIAVTMPGFGTGSRTYDNALALMHGLGVQCREISIVPAVTGHLNDISHPLDRHDATYENAQARERTQILMDVAGDEGGLVVGTGDLSELALGWCTYNGDHMSMYAVNAGLTKSAIRETVGYLAEHTFESVGDILRDIIDTPVSPELLPGTQATEDIVGPYALHDFFLERFICGDSPRQILDAALQREELAPWRDTAAKWLRIFLKRFFAGAFKRSCSPDGPAIFGMSLSPRQGFRMPSDACPDLWLDSLD